jgi:hypothetical protein
LLCPLGEHLPDERPGVGRTTHGEHAEEKANEDDDEHLGSQGEQPGVAVQQPCQGAFDCVLRFLLHHPIATRASEAALQGAGGGLCLGANAATAASPRNTPRSAAGIATTR